MSLKSINQWLTLLANFGVVAGIFFLGIEIRQNQISLDRNSELMEREYQLQITDALQEITDSEDKIRTLLATDSELARIWSRGLSGEELTDTETLQFQSLCEIRIWNTATIFRRLEALGRADLVDLQESNIRAAIGSSPGFGVCWDSNAGGLRHWGFGALVDGVKGAE